MIWDSFLRFLMDLTWLVSLWIGLVMSYRLGSRAGRRLAHSRLGWWIGRRLTRRHGRRPARRHADPVRPPPPPPAPESPEWAASLLVRASGEWLVPSIQLRGPSFPAPARVRLDLMDERSIWRRMSEREVSDPDLGTEVPLPPFRVPEGLDVDEIVGWVWKVVLEVGARTQVLCWQVLRPMAELNREAELGARDDAAV